MPGNGVFISYRRGTGSEVARVIQEFLEGQGFDVFLDVDSLGAGHFDEQLLKQIEARRSFVMVCSPGSLDRCVTEGDWVRRELQHALKTKRHIVPVTLPEFKWPSGQSLPTEVEDLQRRNAFEYSHTHWRHIKPKLVDMLRSGGASWGASETGRQEQPLRTWLDWCEIEAEAPDPALVTDTFGRAGMLATGFPWKVRDRMTGIVMVLCPLGDFMMGSPRGEAGRKEDERQERVSITRAYYLSETSVTQHQWRRVMGEVHAFFKGATNPVENVSWHQCQGFCQRTGLRLPSEVEWEYACRAGTTAAYAGDLDSMAWYHANSGGQTQSVKQKRPNPWGLYDMHGNVWEWCEDTYTQRAAVTQMATHAGSGLHVLRGGGWSNNPTLCRSASRNSLYPDRTYFDNGFRVARTAG